MRSKEFPSWANAMAQQFLVSANHFAWLSRRDGWEALSADLRTGALEPVSLREARNERVLEIVRATLAKLEARLPHPLSAATLVCRFHRDGGDRVRAVCEVRLVESVGREHSGQLEAEVIPQG